ncbi:unnamed protein product, partial [Oppiella nova]
MRWHSFTKHCEYEILYQGGHTIPAGTPIVFHQFSVLMDEKQWPKPNLFKPERFLNKHVLFYGGIEVTKEYFSYPY